MAEQLGKLQVEMKENKQKKWLKWENERDQSTSLSRKGCRTGGATEEAVEIEALGT